MAFGGLPTACAARGDTRTQREAEDATRCWEMKTNMAAGDGAVNADDAGGTVSTAPNELKGAARGGAAMKSRLAGNARYGRARDSAAAASAWRFGGGRRREWRWGDDASGALRRAATRRCHAQA